MNLKADQPVLIDVVGEVGTGNAVDPGAVTIALNDDLVAVPSRVLERVPGLGPDLADPAVTISQIQRSRRDSS